MPKIRDGRPSDAASIAAIYNESIAARDSTMQTTPVVPERVAARIRGLGPREALLVMAASTGVLGYGMLKQYSDRDGYRYTAETSVYLRRARTGEGLGSKIQEALIRRARSADYHHLVAKLWADNERSRALHRKFGYELVGIQQEVGYVEGEWRDIAILQKVLGEGSAGE